MAGQTSLDEVFRFVTLRAVQAVPLKVLLKRTQYFLLLEPASAEGRMAIATSVLSRGSSEDVAREISDVVLGEQIYDALTSALGADNATVDDFLALLPDGIGGYADFERDLRILSDTLLFSALAPSLAPPELDALCRLYIAYLIIEAARVGTLSGDTRLSAIVNQRIHAPFEDSFEVDKPRIRSVGVADLLVVKQHIKRYEASELAHVENVMPGETRTREHRKLELYEETITVERESTTEKEEELTSTERFELEREASRTIKEDQKFAFDLSVSGQMGPVVEFETNFAMEISRSDETVARNATKYAKDVVQRSLERVKERVREERVRRIRREVEENNLHSFTNLTADSIRGLYQFLDKVYEAQVFNYGKRQMFDLMIPEPASYLWHLEETSLTQQAELPAAPDLLTIAPLQLKFEPGDVQDPNHYTRLAAKYGASGLTLPPPLHRRVTAKYVAPTGLATSNEASEGGIAVAPPTVLEFVIPPGYVPETAHIYSLIRSDNVNGVLVSFAIATASEHQKMKPALAGTLRAGSQEGDDSDVEHPGGNISEGQIFIAGKHTQLEFTFPSLDVDYASESKLQLGLHLVETANHAILCEVEFKRTDKHLEAWKLQTYDTIRSAYEDRRLEHADEVARIKAEFEARKVEEDRKLGTPPSARRQIIVTELKKQCIAILRQQWFTEPSPMRSTEPPTFEFGVAQRIGSLVRFFEHAFEWDQIQYAFYPYFWARRSEWEARFRKEDPDYEFQQFLQAGSARVVLSVRPGFEAAVSYFLEHDGALWEGRGEPTISDPLYWSIVEEIRERSSARVDAIPVGEPWEVRLPTTLILLRPQDATPFLPEWQRVADEPWSWTPVEGTTGP